MKIEKIVFAILKEIERGNEAYDEDTFGVLQDDFDDAFRFIIRNNLADNVLFADDRAYFYTSATLTLEGKAYLKENSTWSKAYLLAKEIRDWGKFFF